MEYYIKGNLRKIEYRSISWSDETKKTEKQFCFRNILKKQNRKGEEDNDDNHDKNRVAVMMAEKDNE